MSVTEQARRARMAAIALATATRTVKDAGLHAMADALVARTPEILAGERGGRGGRPRGRALRGDPRPAGADRGAGGRHRRRAARDGRRSPDPVGEVVRGSTLPNGLELRQIRVPFGVVGHHLRGAGRT